jgi:hypothetical protein
VGLYRCGGLRGELAPPYVRVARQGGPAGGVFVVGTGGGRGAELEERPPANVQTSSEGCFNPSTQHERLAGVAPCHRQRPQHEGRGRICTLCNVSSPVCAGISPPRRNPCMRASAVRVHISPPRHTPCSSTSPVRAGISPPCRNPCIVFSAVRAGISTTRGNPCTGSSSARAGTNLTPSRAPETRLRSWACPLPSGV